MSASAFYGIRVHAIISQLLRKCDDRELAKLSDKYTLCTDDISKIRIALDQFVAENNLTNPRSECKLVSSQIHGRCDAVFSRHDKPDDDVIIDWKFVKSKRIAMTTLYQLNIYRAMYKELYNKECDIAVVFISLTNGRFVFNMQQLPVMDEHTVWGMINFAKQKSVS